LELYGCMPEIHRVPTEVTPKLKSV